MRRVALPLAAVCGLGVGVGVVVGCELVAGIKDKTDGTDATAAVDAGDASLGDVSVGDAPAADASGPDPDVPCGEQPPNLFCADFDSVLEAGDGWTWDIPMGGGVVDFSTEYVSPLRSALFTIPNGTASAQLGQNVGQDLTTGYRFAFDLRVDMTDLSMIPQVAAAQVYRTKGQDQLTVSYVLGGGATAYIQLYENETTSPTNLPLPQLPPLQAWTRIVLVYDLQQGLTVIEDGSTILTNAAAAHGAPGQMSIIVGDVYANPPGASATFDIDNVVFRGQ